MTAHAGPVAEPERISSLDTLRGFALLGILVMNVQSFSMPFSTYVNPTVYGDLNGINFAVWLAGHLLFDQKFMSMFSMMFGAGIVLMTARVAERGDGPARLHYRRMLWLLLFGLAHAYALWYGDILYTYALSGLLLYPARKWKPRTLVILGLVSLAVGSLISLFAGLTMPYWPAEEVRKMDEEMWRPIPEVVNREIEAYRGGWLQQMEHRVPTSFEFQTFFTLMFIWKPLGLMLVGMAFYKTGVLAAQASRGFYGGMIASGVLLGLPMIAWGVYRNFSAGWTLRYSMFLGAEWNYWGSLFVAFAWVGAVMLLCQSGAAAGLRSRLAAVGRMAFTNYLLHTFIATSVFYGHGLGYFGRFERWQQFLFVLAVWMFQLWVSPAWLRRFQFGPFEWMWRSLTYGEPQPFRRAPGDGPAVAT